MDCVVGVTHKVHAANYALEMFFFIAANGDNAAKQLLISACISLLLYAVPELAAQFSGLEVVIAALFVLFMFLMSAHVHSLTSLGNLPRVAYNAFLWAFWGEGEDIPVDVRPRLQALPVERWAPASALSIAALRLKLSRLGSARTPTALERHELEAAYTAAYDETCAICCHEYADGDECRLMLRCRHRYHKSCLDTWAKTQGRRGRHPLCPVCQAPI